MRRKKNVVAKLLVIPMIFSGGLFVGYNLKNTKSNKEVIADRQVITMDMIQEKLENLSDEVITTANAETLEDEKKKTLREEHGEVRGVCIATAYAIDFPKVKYNVDKQKEEINTILDNVVEKGFNTVYFQVRPFADALYKSEINPWSKYLTGELGKDPKWDPLEYIIYAGHERGLEIHPWINPFRVSSKIQNVDDFLEDLPDGHIAKNKDLVLQNVSKDEKGNTLTEIYLDPKKEDVKEHIVSTVKEIITKYPTIDGIYMDDYFYPTRYPLPEGESPDGTEANSRRDAVTNIVYAIYDTVKSANSNLTFSISPAAVTKNSEIGTKAGLENYYDLFADVAKWIKDNKVDIIIPQIYFEKGHELVDFTTTSQYWNKLVEGTNVKLVIGHWIDSVKKKKVIDEIDEQIIDSRNLSNCIGSSIYGYGELEFIKDKLSSVYE